MPVLFTGASPGDIADATEYSANWNLVEDSFGVVGPFVASGLVPAAGTGLAVDVTAGTALILGLVDVAAPFSISGLTPSTLNHLYLLIGGTGTSNTTGTPPSNSVKLGTATTDGSSVTAVDTSSASGRQTKMTTANTAMLATNNTFTAEPIIFSSAAAATTERGVVNIGSGGFAGGGGHFAGHASGTLLALNAPSGFAGNLFEAQLNGAPRFVLEEDGATTIFGPTVVDRTDAGTTNRIGCLTLRHRTTGTPANGFGAQTQFFLENDAGGDVEAGAIQCFWSDPTSTTETSRFEVYRRNAGASQLAFSVLAGGYFHMPQGPAVGNANTTVTTLAGPGTVVGYIEVRNAAGASLGALPLYSLGSYS